MKTITTWHVFMDNYDEWYNTLKEAKQAYEELCVDEYANVRLYEDTSEVDGETVEENYITGQGNYPY